METLKIKIRVAQNVDKVWISRKKNTWPHFVPFQAFLSMGRKNPEHVFFFVIFFGGPMGPIHPVWALAAIHPVWEEKVYKGCHINKDVEARLKTTLEKLMLHCKSQIINVTCGALQYRKP